MIGTKYVAFLSPSNEDLAVMKLYSWRDTDEQDLGNEKFLENLDWNLLEKLVREEAPMSRACDIELDRRYKEMVAAYETYKRLYKKEDRDGAKEDGV